VVFPDTNRVIVNDDSDNNNVPQLILQCTSPHIATVLLQITYYTLLVVAGNGLAILTIRFPQNFNESKYIAFSTFSLGVIWIAFILAYFAISNFNDTTLLPAIISLTVQLSAFSVLVCLFGPRVFIMIVWPSQNVLTTTTAVATTKVNVTTLQLKRNSSDQTVNNQNNSEES
jgi:metabotropic glutamate receptor 2/3/metabotropic glutamate receptor 6/7/8